MSIDNWDSWSMKFLFVFLIQLNIEVKVMALQVIFNLYFVQYAKYYAYNHDRRKLHIVYSKRLCQFNLEYSKDL